MACASPPHSLASSASDYGTCGSTYCSDDEPVASYLPGICPHCKETFKEPQTLQCGHSLCTVCVFQLLATLNASPPFRRCRIRMGLRSYNIQKQVSVGMYRSPACLVCSEPPKYFPPVPNLELQLLLRTLESDHPAFRSSIRKMISSSEVKTDPFFRSCKVAIIGARGVGKSSLKRVQHGNDIVFKDILGTSKGSDYLMIEMADGNNSNHDMDTADGFVLVYSITDRRTFRAVTDLFSLLTSKRGPSVSVVLVASKTDLWSERAVSAYEGQSLARSLGCPFLEVSARKNDSVNEAFKELARLVEIQRLKQTVV